MRSFLLILIRCYRYAISPLLGDHCRFYPSCSQYAEQALTEHGAMRGTWLSLKRLSKCHPYHDGGVDMVPPRQTQPTTF